MTARYCINCDSDDIDEDGVCEECGAYGDGELDMDAIVDDDDDEYDDERERHWL